MAMSVNTTPMSRMPAQKMTIAEFLSKAGDKQLNDIFSRVRTGTFSGCHVAFFEATGIWIPELVPVFQKLDAMLVMGDEIKPKGI